MKLTIITPCTRPYNLPAMHASIEPGGQLFDIDWRVVMDTAVRDFAGGKAYEYGAIITAAQVEGSRFGNGQRNAALDAIDDGWVYFLDDDNLMHPDFFIKLYEAMRDNPSMLAFAFDQKERRYVNASEMRVNHIDVAQVCIRRDLIGAQRFELHPYNADGRFIEAVYRSAPHAWGFIPEIMAYYNALR